MKKILFCLLLFQCLMLSAQEQQQQVQQQQQQHRTLILSANDTITERITLPPGENGMEVPVMLKFCFNESANTLTVLAESTVNIFGLQSGVRYRNVFQSGHIFRLGGRFMVEKLPYDVSMDPNNKYRMGKPTRRTLGKRKMRKNYYFRRWIESDGMDLRTACTPVFGKQLLQVFSLSAGLEKATLNFHDIFTVDHKGITPKKWKRLMLTSHNDIGITYELQFQHNPCFGKEKEIAAAKEKLQTLEGRIKKLVADHPATKPLPPASYEAFIAHRDSIISAFPLQTQQSDCPDLQEIYDSYNSQVQELLKMHREMKMPATPPANEMVSNLLGTKSVDANSLQFKARQLDELVGRWMLTSEREERLNIRSQCNKIIEDAAKMTEGRVVKTDEQRRAVHTFQRALDYYRRTVK